jgi:glycosyltransferase involved in cell wall biosynthesis
MRVLHFYKTYYPDTLGGIEAIIYELATHLPEFDIEVEVLSLSPSKNSSCILFKNHIIHKSYENFRFASTGFSLSAIYDFKKLVANVDVIHYHFPWPFMDFIHFISAINKPTVVTYHSDIVRQKILYYIYRPLMNCFLRSVTSIVATSPNYLETSFSLNKFKDKVEVIPLGIDKLNYETPTSELVSYWSSIVGEKFFLFIGVLRYYKGLFTLLDALSLHEFPMVIIGAGPMEDELKARASFLGLKKIVFVGQVTSYDKATLLQLSLSIVFPSNLRSEAFGISLLEGAMYGKPLISCEIGTGTSYVNIHGVTGLVVPPNDADALSDAMSMLWNNPHLSMRLGKNAEKRYLKLFTAKEMANKYALLYKRLIKAASTKR